MNEPTGRYNFFTFNSKAGINMNLPTRIMDWRILGVELGYIYEFGPYQDKLSEIKKEQLSALVFNKRTIWQFNFYSEAIFKVSNNKALGMGIYVGDTLNRTGELKEYDSSFYGAILSFKFNRYTLSLVDEMGNEGISSTKLSLAYQFY